MLIAEYNVINRDLTVTTIENIRRICFCSLDIGLTLLLAKIEVLRLENNPNMLNVVESSYNIVKNRKHKTEINFGRI